jgi:hypothetical protein
MHNLGDPDATLTEDAVAQQPLSLDDIAGMLALAQSHPEEAEPLEGSSSRHAARKAANQAVNAMATLPITGFNFLTRSAVHEGVLNWKSDGPPSNSLSLDYDNEDGEAMEGTQAGKKKKGFFDRLRRKRRSEITDHNSRPLID